MEWIESITKAIDYIEANITEDLKIDEISKHVFISSFYFQKGFSMLCGYSVGEYIRDRRLSLAGHDLISSNEKIIDIALKYHYSSPDSFTKAFTRFHGVTPSALRKDKVMIKSFAPLKINISLEGGYVMNFKIIEKEAFTVIGVSKFFKLDDMKNEIPKFWNEHYQSEKSKTICGMYGICIESNSDSEQHEYLIADNYNPIQEVSGDYVTRCIPKHTWAIFACKGSMPNALQETNYKIFSEWLPNCKEYEIAAGYNIEMYSDTKKYPKGTQDENYYSEIWIPVKKK